MENLAGGQGVERLLGSWDKAGPDYIRLSAEEAGGGGSEQPVGGAGELGTGFPEGTAEFRMTVLLSGPKPSIGLVSQHHGDFSMVINRDLAR